MRRSVGVPRRRVEIARKHSPTQPEATRWVPAHGKALKKFIAFVKLPPELIEPLLMHAFPDAEALAQSRWCCDLGALVLSRHSSEQPAVLDGAVSLDKAGKPVLSTDSGAVKIIDPDAPPSKKAVKRAAKKERRRVEREAKRAAAAGAIKPTTGEVKLKVEADVKPKLRKRKAIVVIEDVDIDPFAHERYPQLAAVKIEPDGDDVKSAVGKRKRTAVKVESDAGDVKPALASKKHRRVKVEPV